MDNNLKGRWIRQLKFSEWLYLDETGKYFQIIEEGTMGSCVYVQHPEKGRQSMSKSRFDDVKRKIEFELMPEGFIPNEIVTQYQIY